MMSQESVFPS